MACLGPGPFFGEVEHTHCGHSIGSVPASNGGTRSALNPRDAFYKLIVSTQPRGNGGVFLGGETPQKHTPSHHYLGKAELLQLIDVTPETRVPSKKSLKPAWRNQEG